MSRDNAGAKRKKVSSTGMNMMWESDVMIQGLYKHGEMNCLAVNREWNPPHTPTALDSDTAKHRKEHGLKEKAEAVARRIVFFIVTHVDLRI